MFFFPFFLLFLPMCRFEVWCGNVNASLFYYKINVLFDKKKKKPNWFKNFHATSFWWMWRKTTNKNKTHEQHDININLLMHLNLVLQLPTCISLCDVKVFLTFTSPNMVLLWQLFYLFCSCISILLQWQPEPLNRHESGRFGALKSDSTHHFFRNACTKSGSLRFSQFSGCWLILSVYIIMSFDFPFVRLFGVR